MSDPESMRPSASARPSRMPGPSRPAGAPGPSRTSWGLFLGLALGLALLRFFKLGTWGLWVDEAHTLHDSLAPGGFSILDYPLGYLLTRGAMDLMGGSLDEWTLRLAPACLGALGIPLTYWAARPFVGRHRAAAAALIVGVSAWHLYWSQSARAYTLAQDLALIGGGLVARGVLAGRRRLHLLGIAIAALAAFAHPSAAFLLPVWVLGPAALQRLGVSLPRRYATAPLILAVLAGALVLGGWGVSVWGNYWDAKQGSSIVHYLLSTGFYVTPFLALAALAGSLVAWRRRDAFDLLVLAACATVGSLGVLASFFVIVTAQYVFVALPWIAILATAPLELRLLHERRWARWALLGLLLVPALADCALYFGPRHGNRPRWSEAYAYVWSERGPEDLIVGMAAPVGEYYLDPGATHLRSHRSLVRLNPYSRHIPAHWARQGRRIWYVVRHEDLATWEPADRAAFQQVLETQCRLAAVFEVEYTPRDLDVAVYVREADGGAGGEAR